MMSPMVTSRTTRFNIHKLYILFTKCIAVVYDSQNKQKLFTVQYKLNL